MISTVFFYFIYHIKTHLVDFLKLLTIILQCSKFFKRNSKFCKIFSKFFIRPCYKMLGEALEADHRFFGYGWCCVSAALLGSRTGSFLFPVSWVGCLGLISQQILVVTWTEREFTPIQSPCQKGQKGRTNPPRCLLAVVGRGPSP